MEVSEQPSSPRVDLDKKDESNLSEKEGGSLQHEEPHALES